MSPQNSSQMFSFFARSIRRGIACRLRRSMHVLCQNNIPSSWFGILALGTIRATSFLFTLELHVPHHIGELDEFLFGKHYVAFSAALRWPSEYNMKGDDKLR
jgi:hypothetical protein